MVISCDTQWCFSDVVLASSTCLTLTESRSSSFAKLMVKPARAAPVASLRLFQPPFRPGCSSPPVQRFRALCPLATCLSSSRDRLALRGGATLSRLEQLACKLLCCDCRDTSRPTSLWISSYSSSQWACVRTFANTSSVLLIGLGIRSSNFAKGFSRAPVPT